MVNRFFSFSEVFRYYTRLKVRHSGWISLALFFWSPLQIFWNGSRRLDLPPSFLWRFPCSTPFNTTRVVVTLSLYLSTSPKESRDTKGPDPPSLSCADTKWQPVNWGSHFSRDDLVSFPYRTTSFRPLPTGFLRTFRRKFQEEEVVLLLVVRIF